MIGKLRTILAILAALMLLPAFSRAAENGRSHLVGVDWLEKHRQDAGILILDASPAPIYGANHIPGAVHVDMLAYGRPEIPLAEMRGIFQSWGVSPEKTIVMYDQGGNMLATRVFFSLYYHGFPANQLFLLDGGLSQWQAAKLPVSNVAPPARPGTFAPANLIREAKADTPEVLAATGEPANNALIEALGADWHFGEMRAFHRAGHIPNGILIPSGDFFNPDKTFKSPGEIRRMLTYFHIRPEQRIYTYCGGGVAASVPFFALKFILNYPSVKLYVDSELGWLSDERDLPYWTYDAPYLMRDTAWLQFWGGRMLRSFRPSRVSILDIRPRAMYDQGHLPFAVNIPADVFASNLANPPRMVEILGQAGVDPSQEAVIVSGAGLTKESALAFVVLQRFQQARVSIFMDSMETAARLGYALTKDATVVGAPKSPGDLALPPATYPLRAQRTVIASDLSMPGLYDRFFMASGRSLPTKPRDGKMILLPAANFLNAGGTPKPAKEIWNILAKAGVPRYAQLVFVADDPGEAALNYFLFQLMGFPDLRMLVDDSL